MYMTAVGFSLVWNGILFLIENIQFNSDIEEILNLIFSGALITATFWVCTNVLYIFPLRRILT